MLIVKLSSVYTWWLVLYIFEKLAYKFGLKGIGKFYIDTDLIFLVVKHPSFNHILWLYRSGFNFDGVHKIFIILFYSLYHVLI